MSTVEQHTTTRRTPVRVLLAHENRLELVGLARSLAERAVEVVGEAHTQEQVIPLVAHTRPDVLVVSARIAGREGYALLATLRRRFRSTEAVVLGGSEDAGRAAEACEAGAAGFVSTAVDPRNLAALIVEAAAGTVCFLPRVQEPQEESVLLTERERAVLIGAARGLSNTAIGRELWLSPHTVKSHLHRIYAKLDVTNRTEAACWAVENRLLEPETFRG